MIGQPNKRLDFWRSGLVLGRDLPMRRSWADTVINKEKVTFIESLNESTSMRLI